MELKLYCTPHGLIPCYDEDLEEKKKLRIGEYYTAKITLERNPRFHRKYFALFRIAWEYQNEYTQSWFGTVDNFRKTIEVAAGHYDRVYSLSLNDWVEVPRSVAFDKMDESEFSDLYERVKHILFTQFLPDGVSEDDFFEELRNF